MGVENVSVPGIKYFFDDDDNNVLVGYEDKNNEQSVIAPLPYVDPPDSFKFEISPWIKETLAKRPSFGNDLIGNTVGFWVGKPSKEVVLEDCAVVLGLAAMPILVAAGLIISACGGNEEVSGCNVYPAEKILDELQITYENGTEELPGERKNIQEILSSIDYRFTEGIKSVNVLELEECEQKGTYQVRQNGAEIELCRQKDGKGGAFVDSFYSLQTVLYRQVGHNVEHKIGQETLDFFYSLVPSDYKPGKAFADGFFKYILGGALYRHGLFEDFEGELATYEWLKETVFCDQEYQGNRHPTFQYDMARSYHDSRHYNTAITEYEKLIQDFPHSKLVARAKIGIGQVYFDLGQCDKAFEIFEEVKVEYPDVADVAQYWIAETYFCLNDYDSALREYQNLIDEYPDSIYVPYALFQMGLIYREFLDCPRVIKIFQRLIDEYPDYHNRPYAMLVLGYCYQESNDCPRKIEILQRLIDEYPDFPYNDRAQEMIDACGVGFKIDPSQDCNIYPPESILNDGLEIKYADGVEELPGERERILEIITSIDYRFTEGISFIEISEEDEVCTRSAGAYGEGNHRILLCRDPDGIRGAFIDDNKLRWTIHHEVGHQVALKIGDKVLEFYSLIQSIWPEVELREAFPNLLTDYSLKGPYFGSIEHLRPIYDLFKTDLFCGNEFEENYSDSSQHWTGVNYLSQGDCNRALEEFQKLIDNFPDSDYVSDAYIGIGKSHRCLEDCGEALSTFEEVKLAYPEKADVAQYEIAGTYRNCLEDYESAIREYRKVVNEYPNSPYAPLALYHIGNICKYDLEDCGRAIAAYQEFIDNYSEIASSSTIGSAMFNIGECHYQLSDCLSAVATLQRFVDEFPDSHYNDRAQEIIDACAE